MPVGSGARKKPLTANDEQDLSSISRFLDGDPSGFEELVRRHSPGVNAFCARAVGTAVGEELAQEAFARAYRALRDSDSVVHFRHWVYRVAQNLCRDELKSNRPRESTHASLDACEQSISAEPQPHERASFRQVLSALGKALDQLEPMYREPFVLWHVEHVPYTAMAEILGGDVGLMKVRVHRARERLREMLGPMLDED
ncbi:MAG: sigma-70 family RNA polymerase sigma factor [Deltaproteobacteria bacterium]|nr:sigma-70 family RNA polymerase sigma factor [Deltaproteobacteria bacterium]